MDGLSINQNLVHTHGGYFVVLNMTKVTTTKYYNFSLTFKLKEPNIDSQIYLDQLYEVGCDDALIGVGKKGYIGLDFIRESICAYEAIDSAINDVKLVINDAKLIHISPDLTGIKDLTTIFDCSRQNIQKFVNKTTFPNSEYKGSQAIWHLAEVLNWFKSNGYQVREELLEIAELAMSINVEIKNQNIKKETLIKAHNLVAS